MMKPTLLKNVKRGEVFKLRPTDSATVWVRDEYDREDKKYEYHDFFNIGRWNYSKGTRIVYINFDW